MNKLILLTDKSGPYVKRNLLYRKDVRPEFHVTDYLEPKDYPSRCVMTPSDVIRVLESDGWEQIHYDPAWSIVDYADYMDTTEMTKMIFKDGHIHRIIQEYHNKFTVWGEGE